MSYWEWFKLIATSFLISCALTAACIALSWLVLRHAPSPGGASRTDDCDSISARKGGEAVADRGGRCVTW